jgi:hypothetical protein
MIMEGQAAVRLDHATASWQREGGQTGCRSANSVPRSDQAQYGALGRMVCGGTARALQRQQQQHKRSEAASHCRCKGSTPRRPQHVGQRDRTGMQQSQRTSPTRSLVLVGSGSSWRRGRLMKARRARTQQRRPAHAAPTQPPSSIAG